MNVWIIEHQDGDRGEVLGVYASREAGEVLGVYASREAALPAFIEAAKDIFKYNIAKDELFKSHQGANGSLGISPNPYDHLDLTPYPVQGGPAQITAA